MNNVNFPYTRKEAKEAGIEFYSEINRNAGFPKRMRESRKRLGETLERTVSQEEAAKAIGVTRSTIGLYETGDNVPDIKTIVKIADFYQVTVNYLLGIDDRPTYEQDYIGKSTGLSDKTIKLLTKWGGTYGGVNYAETLDFLIEDIHNNKLILTIGSYLFDDLEGINATIMSICDNNNYNPVLINAEHMRNMYLIQIQTSLANMRQELLERRRENAEKAEPKRDGQHTSSR